MSNSNVTVAVLGLMNNDFPAPAIAMAVALKDQQDLTLIGLVTSPYETGAYYPELFKEVYHVPNPKDQTTFLRRLQEINQRRAINVMITGTLEYQIGLTELAAALKAFGIKTFCPPADLLPLVDLKRLPAVAGEHGLPIETMITLTTEAEVSSKLPDAFTFPLEAYTASGQVFPLEDEEDIEALEKKLTANLPVTIRPKEKNGIEVALVADTSSRICSWVAISKLATAKDGTPWLGITFTDQNLKNRVQKFIHSFAWIGPLTLGFARRKSGYYLRYAYPHLPGWSAIFPTCGANPALAQIKLALGLQVAPEDPIPHVLFSHGAHEILSDIDTFAHFQLTGYLSHDQA